MRSNKLYLAHHGIKGQKWGVRRFQDTNGRLTAAGKERLKSKKSDSAYSDENIEKGMSEIAIFLALQAATIAVPLAIETGVAVYNNHKGNKIIKQHNKNLEDAEIDEKIGLPLKHSNDSTMEEDAKMVNPHYLKFDSDPDYTHNCMMCSTTYELRRRGYEVQVNGTPQGFADDKVKDWFKGAKVTNIIAADVPKKFTDHKVPENAPVKASDISNALGAQPDGARGNFMFVYRDSWSGSVLGGHSVAYEKKDGTVYIVDSQVNKVQTLEKWHKDTTRNMYVSNTTFCRTDNLKLKEGVKECVNL